MQLATRLGSIELEEIVSGQSLSLASLWDQRPAVLLFLRHFG